MKPIKLGIVGTGRGQAFMNVIRYYDDFEFYAVCDRNEEKLQIIKSRFPDVRTFTNYEDLLNTDVEAVFLCNYFDEHAPFAIKALKAGKHVISEVSSNSTIAEGVELCRTVEQSGKIYMLAENYPYKRNLLEMHRRYQMGEFGEVMLADGEYVHNMTFRTMYKISNGKYHWRNTIPSTYYCTHALGPLMYITDTMPKYVTGWTNKNESSYRKGSIKLSDSSGIINCIMDNGAIFRTLQGQLTPDSWGYRIMGTLGGAEVDRWTGDLFIWHNAWEKGDNPERLLIRPNWPEHGDLASKAGHDGGDFWTLYYFAKAIREGVQPYFDVYRGVAASSVGILAWKSVIDGNVPYAVPDFRNEEERKKYENDTWNPIRKENIDPETQPPVTITGWKPAEEDLEAAKKVWEETKYWGLGW